MPPKRVPGESREVWVQLLITVIRLADGTREWRNCFLATARELGFETSVLEKCVSVLRGSQQRYHVIIGVAVDDIAGGRDEVWEQAISKLKKRFTFGHWEVGKRKFCRQVIVQAAAGSCARWTACLYQESGLYAPRKTDERTIGRCKRY